jgi:hypothetical protein
MKDIFILCLQYIHRIYCKDLQSIFGNTYLPTWQVFGMWLHNKCLKEILITKNRTTYLYNISCRYIIDKFKKCPSFILCFCGEQMMDSFLIHPEHLWGIFDRTNLEYIQLLSDKFTENFC